MDIKPQLARGYPLVLDGATATELQRSEVTVAAPWWSSVVLLSEEGRRLLRQVHVAHVRAGAEIITANTFRTNRRALERAGVERGDSRLVHVAVEEAQRAREASGVARPIFVAGSMAPIEDCYQPALVPSDTELREEHAWFARALADAGVDLVLVETMNSMREARIALESVRALDLPAFVSFVCADGDTLLSGESLASAARAMEEAGASAVLVNCVPPSQVAGCLASLRQGCALPIGVYPNIEDRSGIEDWKHVPHYVKTALSPETLAAKMAEWHAAFHLDVVGGCCGVSPEYIAAICEQLALDRSDTRDPGQQS
jgi:S-methylmethionine-dependent homocysteine/selenocysteine methylase